MTNNLSEDKSNPEVDKMANGGKIRKAPFKLGDMVYSYQNPNDKMRVSFIEDRGIIDGVDYGWNIKVALKTDSDGNYNPKGTYSKSSKWMSQNSVSKTKKEKYTTGGSMTGWKHKMKDGGTSGYSWIDPRVKELTDKLSRENKNDVVRVVIEYHINKNEKETIDKLRELGAKYSIENDNETSRNIAEIGSIIIKHKK
jgi:hypothetical protein